MIVDKELLTELKTIRQKIHAHPELSGEEKNTAHIVHEFLQQCEPAKIYAKVGGNGIIAQFGQGNARPSLMFRADMDALPIEEVNTFDYRSTVQGVSHKCGHDGHTSILLGLARVLSQNPQQKAKIFLLFQPSEEDGRGAKAVIRDPVFSIVKPDFMYAFHNLPGFPLNDIIVKDNSFTAAVKSLVVKLNGKTAHAGEPENGLNPAACIAEIILAAKEFSNNQPELSDFSLITPIHIRMGEIAYGISAGEGEVHFTIRTWTQENMQKLAAQLVDSTKTIARRHKLSADFTWTHEFAANENDTGAVENICRSAESLSLNINERQHPFKWGEDFGLFTQHIKGAMFGIGSGVKCPALHNPDYDFPDAIIATGINMFYQIIQRH